MIYTHQSDNHGKELSPIKGMDGYILSGDQANNNVDNFTPGIMHEGVFTPKSWRGFWNFRMIDKVAEAKEQREWWMKQLDALKKKGYGPEKIIFCPGNHDFVDMTDLLPYSCWQTPKTITFNGIKVGLLPGVLPLVNEWNDEITEYEIKQRILSIDPDIDLLVSHVPPYGILDAGHGTQHIGSQELYTAIMGGAFGSIPPHFTKLQLHCFGHAHGGRGVDTFSIGKRKIKFSNAAESRHDHMEVKS